MSSVYTVQSASPLLDGDIIRFFENFYRITDTPTEINLYLGQFIPNAVFIRGVCEVNHGINGEACPSPSQLLIVVAGINTYLITPDRNQELARKFIQVHEILYAYLAQHPLIRA